MDEARVLKTRGLRGMAERAAARVGSDYAGPEHLLLGVALESPGTLVSGVTGARVVEAATARMNVVVSEAVRIDRVPLTSVLKRLIGRLELRGTGIPLVEVLHELASDPQSRAARVLEAVGLEPGVLAKHVEAATGVPPFEISLDDDSSQTFNEQIIEKIKEAIARGRLRAGERLPSVRGLADRLGVAPGTVARAYADLSQQGVLEGDRVKGTRVPPGGPDRPDDAYQVLSGMVKPVAVAAYHLGVSREEVYQALTDAMDGIVPDDGM